MKICELEIDVDKEVYEPAEDSFLLAKWVGKLKGKVLDVGCGCGLLALVCAKQNPNNEVLGVDLNPKAIENSVHNAEKNKIFNVRFLNSDLFSKVKEKFDGIIFNPPYLPTSKKEKVRGKLNLAFDGGKSGRKITDRFLVSLSAHLKKSGKLIMVESSLAGIEKTIAKLRKLGFDAKIIDEKKFFFERIVVIEAKWKER